MRLCMSCCDKRDKWQFSIPFVVHRDTCQKCLKGRSCVDTFYKMKKSLEKNETTLGTKT